MTRIYKGSFKVGNKVLTDKIDGKPGFVGTITEHYDDNTYVVRLPGGSGIRHENNIELLVD